MSPDTAALHKHKVGETRTATKENPPIFPAVPHPYICTLCKYSEISVAKQRYRLKTRYFLPFRQKNAPDAAPESQPSKCRTDAGRYGRGDIARALRLQEENRFIESALRQT